MPALSSASSIVVHASRWDWGPCRSVVGSVRCGSGSVKTSCLSVLWPFPPYRRGNGLISTAPSERAPLTCPRTAQEPPLGPNINLSSLAQDAVFSPMWRNACRFEAPWSFRALPAIGVSAGPRDRHHRVERRRLALEPLGRRAPRSCGREPAGGRRRRERPPAPSPMWRRARARARPARVCGRAQACLRACARWWVLGSWENAWQCVGRAWGGT